MKPDLFKQLWPFSEARACVLREALRVTRRERVTLEQADGRVVARDLIAPINVPPFDRASMDGYAIVATDVVRASSDSPVPLTCVGRVLTGDHTALSVTPGHCVEIATGAPLPHGATAVVMVEATSRLGDSVHVKAAIAAGQNIGRAGADLSAGCVALRIGDVITPARAGVLAAIGETGVDVFARPIVAILSTGNEIVAPGRNLEPGQLYDVNRYTVSSVVRRNGGVARPLPLAADDLTTLTQAVREAAVGSDVLVISGGSSVGAHDLTTDVLSALGQIYFHGIAVKPGKPTLFGRIGSTLVLGMPGYPTSCLSNAYMLLLPMLRSVAGLPPWRPETVVAPLARAITSAVGRHQFYTVRIENGQAVPAFKSSGDITSLAAADGYIEIAADCDGLPVGAPVLVTRF